jgi:MoaA/NifB/PqqE/SkfB family radical SAM enzyme
MASVKLTHRCNLSCRACPFHRGADADERHMGWETARSSIESLEAVGCAVVIFEGGEPLLWTDGRRTFSDLARLARGRFACVGATTNGTMALDVPTDLVWVSIDGSRRTHDALRSGSYDRALDNIRSSKHPRIYVHTTVNRENFGELPLIAKEVCAIPQVKGMTVQFFYPYRRGEDDLSLSRAQRTRAIEDALWLKRLGYPILNSSRGLEAMKDNTWRCRPFLLANVDPDGAIRIGCYASTRAQVNCSECGFTPMAELSLAFDLSPGAMAAGLRIFA